MTLTLLLIRALPFDIALFFSRLFLTLYLLIRRDYRQEIRTNYQLIFGKPNRWFWLSNGWRIGRNLALMAQIGTRKSFELIDRAVIYAENNNVHVQPRIMVSYHWGLWEFLPSVFAKNGIDVAVVVSRQRNALVEKILDTIRTATAGIKIVSSKGGSRTALAAIHHSFLIGFALDNTSQGKQKWIEAEGIAMRLPVLPFQLGRQSQGTTPVFCYLENGRLKVNIFPPGDEANALRTLLKMVRHHPEEWVFWGKAGALKAQ